MDIIPPMVSHIVRGPLTYEVHESPSTISTEVIEELAPDLKFILSPLFTLKLENSLKSLRFKHILVREDKTLTALIFFYETVARSFRIAVCGHPLLCVDCGIRTGKFEHIDDINDEIIKQLPEIMRSRGNHALIVKDTSLGSQFQKTRCYFEIPSEPALALEGVSRWKSFDEYLSDINRKYRNNIRRARNKLRNQEIRINFNDDFTEHKQLHDLFLNVANHVPSVRPKGVPWITHFITNIPRQYKLRELSPEFFKNVLPAFPDNIDIVTLKRDNRIVAYTVNVKDSNVYYSLFIGLDEHISYADSYRAILSAKLEKAFTLNVSKIVFGRTASTTKIEFGAEPINLKWWGTILVPPWNSFNRPLSWSLSKVPSVTLPIRNVFCGERP